MDDVDRAQARLEWVEEMRKRDRKADVRESALFCEDCATRIPEPRRQASRGTQTCISCQESRERDLMMENF